VGRKRNSSEVSPSCTNKHAYRLGGHREGDLQELQNSEFLARLNLQFDMKELQHHHKAQHNLIKHWDIQSENEHLL